MELTYAQEAFISDHHRYDSEDVTQLLSEVYSDIPEDLDLNWLSNFYDEVQKNGQVTLVP